MISSKENEEVINGKEKEILAARGKKMIALSGELFAIMVVRWKKMVLLMQCAKACPSYWLGD